MTNKENPCTKCKEHCCIGPIGTFITIHDAKRMSDYSKLPMNEFCFFGNISKDPKWQKVLMDEKDHSYFKISSTGKILQLKSKDNDECIFLKDFKCEVHPSRPLVCKIFPVGYKFDGSLCYFEEDEYCKFMHEDVCVTCKNIGLSIDEVKKIVKQHLEEVEQYKKYEKYFLEDKSVEEVWEIVSKK
tara:strand:+ start:8052 stop:8609 length:558 start_codon:yes stop_codon:yes gene_type:complete